MVVHHNHLHWALLFHDGAEFLDTHLEATVAHEAADRTLRSSKRGSDGCRHAVAHRSQTTAGTNTTMVVVLEITGSEKLVLTHIGNKNRIIWTQFGHDIHDLSHQQRSILRMDSRLYHLLTLFLVELSERVAPALMTILFQQSGDGWQ